MATERVERRLAAILAADVAGYSRLMSVDEEGTHERLKAHFHQLINPKITEHGGRVVKNTGDGMLAEFPSAVDAVRCAAEMQRAMIERDVDIPDDKRISFRIGINLGDVIVEPQDIFGDGVNIAARLEAIAEAGGICIYLAGVRAVLPNIGTVARQWDRAYRHYSPRMGKPPGPMVENQRLYASIGYEETGRGTRVRGGGGIAARLSRNPALHA